MISILTRARSPMAAGRRAFRAGLALLVVSACTTVGADPRPTAPAEPLDPPIRVPAGGARADATADRLLADARAALATNYAEAIRLAEEVVRAHAGAVGSSGALRVLATAHLARSEWDDAESNALRFADLLPPSDDRAVDMRILAGDAAHGAGRSEDALGHWLRIPGTADAERLRRASERVAGIVGELDAEALRRRLDEAAQGPLIAPVAARLALERYTEGNRDLAARLGQVAVEAGAEGEFRRIADAAVAGDMSEFVVTPRIGLVLPTTGSPRLRQVADEIAEGVQVAIEEYRAGDGSRVSVELVRRDNRGREGLGAGIVADLEGEGVIGVIGPLQDLMLDELAAARSTVLPVVSPTAPEIIQGTTDVYSLQTAEPGAARALAEYAADRGIETAVLIFPELRESTAEAAAFRDAFGALGGTILGEFAYSPDSTYFESQILGAARLDPDVVVLPLPAMSVELMAPQITFFGLDSLGIEVLGTSGWADPNVLQRVDPRHTNGVVTATPQPAEGESEGARRFREAYETRFSRTLRSGVPAYGYDATLLILEALSAGERSPDAVARSLGSIEGVEGATGRLSIQDGRVSREHYLVCIQDRRPQDLFPGERPRNTLFAPLPDPETDSIPEGATPRIVGFRCPGAPRPAGSLDDLVYHPDSAFLRPDSTAPPAAVDTFFVRR